MFISHRCVLSYRTEHGEYCTKMKIRKKKIYFSIYNRYFPFTSRKHTSLLLEHNVAFLANVFVFFLFPVLFYFHLNLCVSFKYFFL